MTSKYFLIAAIALCSMAIATCTSIPKAASSANADTKQLFLGAQSKETSTPDFVRLLVMRLIYGIASTMGLEERLSGLFNGAFVPPGEDDSDYGFDFGGADEIFEER